MNILNKIDFILEDHQSDIDNHKKRIEHYQHEIELIRQDIENSKSYNSSLGDLERYHKQIKQIQGYIKREHQIIKNIGIQARHEKRMNRK